MGFAKSLKQYWSKAVNSVTSGDKFYSLTDPNSELFSLLGRDYTFGTQSKDYLLKAYGLSPYVFMVIDRIVQRLVQADKLTLDRSGTIVDNKDFNELFEKPNSKETGDDILYRFAATFLAAGEAFLVRRQTLGDRDEYFVPVNYNVIVNQDTKGEPYSYRITHFGNSETYLPGEVLHLNRPDITIDTNHGFSTLRAIRKVWESNSEVWNSEAAIHKNKGVSGILFSKGQRPMTPAEEKQLQNKYDMDNTGAHNFGKVKVSTSELGYIPMGMNPNDLKSIESRIDHLRTICASYNVDSKLFGDPEASTYNNMAEAKAAFITNAVMPLGRLILPKISAFMARSLFAFYRLELDEEAIEELQVIHDQRSARIGREVVQGILSKRKARELLYPNLVESEESEEGSTAPVEEIEASTLSVTDILQIQRDLTSGAITRPGALAILTQLYGFTDQDANEILGNEG